MLTRFLREESERWARGNPGPQRQGDRASRQARAGVCGRRGSAGRSLGSRGLEPRVGGGRAGGDPVAVTLPLGLRAGLRAAGCWLWGPAPPPIRLLRLGACSRRRLRCQQTRGASLPGPPLSNSERVPPTGPAANAGGGGRRFRGARGGSSPGGAGAAGCGVWVGPAGSRARCSGGSLASE